MGTKGSKRIYYRRVVKWMSDNKIIGIPASLGLIGFLIYLNAITVLSYSGDMQCAGTVEDPCLALIKFEANNDIFIYPDESWGISTDRPIKEVTLYRSWGTGWREIDLTKTCTGTWCGGKRGATSNAYSFVFRAGKTYKIKYEALKYDPFEDIKWWIDELGVPDPIWVGANYSVNYTCSLISATGRFSNFSSVNCTGQVDRELLINNQSVFIWKNMTFELFTNGSNVANESGIEVITGNTTRRLINFSITDNVGSVKMTQVVDNNNITFGNSTGNQTIINITSEKV